MAVGSTISNVANIAAQNSTQNIQPDSGDEWRVENVCYDQSIELYLISGSVLVLIDAPTAGGQISGPWFLTNTVYLQIKNIYAGSNDVGWTGFKTVD